MLQPPFLWSVSSCIIVLICLNPFTDCFRSWCKSLNKRGLLFLIFCLHKHTRERSWNTTTNHSPHSESSPLFHYCFLFTVFLFFISQTFLETPGGFLWFEAVMQYYSAVNCHPDGPSTMQQIKLQQYSPEFPALSLTASLLLAFRNAPT